MEDVSLHTAILPFYENTVFRKRAKFKFEFPAQSSPPRCEVPLFDARTQDEEEEEDLPV